MCEHYGAEGFAKGSSGYYEKCKALRQHVFAPLIRDMQQTCSRHAGHPKHFLSRTADMQDILNTF